METYTAPVVSCSRCGRELSDEEIRFLWLDKDWLDHGDHYAVVAEEQLPVYFDKAKRLAENQ